MNIDKNLISFKIVPVFNYNCKKSVLNKRERVSIFIDYPNLLGSWQEYFKSPKVQIQAEAWANLNNSLLEMYGQITEQSTTNINHRSTLICYPANQQIHRGRGDFLFARKMAKMSLNPKMVIHQQPRKERDNKESGVDAYLVSWMLLGAKRKLFDSAILVTQDNDYTPAVETMQSSYHTRVFQAAYYNMYSQFAFLRAECFGHLDLGELDADFKSLVKL